MTRETRELLLCAAKQEATKVLGDLQLKLLTLEVECEVCRPNAGL
jgi:hypothetical protein